MMFLRTTDETKQAASTTVFMKTINSLERKLVIWMRSQYVGMNG
jgi:hypothetical protein